MKPQTTTADDKFAAALGGKRFGVSPPAAAPRAAAMPNGTRSVAPIGAVPPAPAKQPTANTIVIGEIETGGSLELDLVKLLEGRLLIQGVSGAGKSWTLRRLLEQTAQYIQQIVVDPEGEFKSLAELLGHLYVAGHQLDAEALVTLGRRVREHRLSVVLDLSQMAREEQLKALAAFAFALVQAPKEHWHPAIVAVDEAHIFAPWGTDVEAKIRRVSVSAMTDIMGLGRKRGLVGVLATRRLARIAKSVISDVHNFLVGMNTLDLDVRRAAETIGWSTRKAFDRLPLLKAGEFLCVGYAFSASPSLLKVGSIQSRHIGATPDLGIRKEVDNETARGLLGFDKLVAESEEREENETRLAPGYREVRQFIRELNFGLAGLIFEALRPLYPDGALIDELWRKLDRPSEYVCDAIALLDKYGTVEITGDAEHRAVRIAHKFLNTSDA